MPESWFLRGLIVAIIFGVPAGAVGALTLHRSLQSGFAAGFVTGLGSTAADVIYASIGVFGVSLVSEVLLTHQDVIRTVGGVFILLLGIGMLRKKSDETQSASAATRLPACFGTAFAVAISNPATILSFITALAVLGIEQSLTVRDGVQVVAGIALGTTAWWAALAGVASRFQKRITARAMSVLRAILGAFLMLFGLYAVLRAWL